jgi:2-polyprenyl-3-methyl-5-hydroxy-6-metoxy-1,4-benzoquinol methylase
MPSFKHRSNQKELLDDLHISFEDIKQNMRELDVINNKLGGRAITLKGIQNLIHKVAPQQKIHIVEIGCGGGDNLKSIKKWAEKRKVNIQLTGIDINEACIKYALGQKVNSGISFICSDYTDLQLPQLPDIIFSSLFCHHFNDDELVFMLNWMKHNSKLGFFINDLHRNALAYYSIKGLTQIFSKSYLVKNDAPLSVQRGFIKNDWKKLFKNAGIENYTCKWQWAFRWLIIYKNDS